MAETNLLGVYFGGGFIAACIAAVLLMLLRQVLARIGFYALVWNRPLVDIAFFTVLWALTSTLVPYVIAGPGGAP